MDFSPLSPGAKGKKLVLDMGICSLTSLYSPCIFFLLWTYRTFCFLLKYIFQFTGKRMTFVVADKLKSLSDKRMFLHQMDLVIYI